MFVFYFAYYLTIMLAQAAQLNLNKIRLSCYLIFTLKNHQIHEK